MPNQYTWSSIEERLGSKIEMGERPGACWNWTGAISRLGYGQFKYKGTMKGAHRVVYELINSAIPEGMELDHICRNRGCVNPMHLRIVTHRENVLAGESLMAARARQTHCIHGHLLSGDNLIIRPGGGRKCKTCQRAAERRYKARRRK